MSTGINLFSINEMIHDHKDAYPDVSRSLLIYVQLLLDLKKYDKLYQKVLYINRITFKSKIDSKIHKVLLNEITLSYALNFSLYIVIKFVPNLAIFELNKLFIQYLYGMSCKKVYPSLKINMQHFLSTKIIKYINITP